MSGSDSKICSHLTSLYAGIPKDGNRYVVGESLKALCNTVVPTEHCQIVLFPQDQNGFPLLGGVESDVLFEISTVVYTDRIQLAINDVNADARFGEAKIRFQEVHKIELRSIVSIPIFTEDGAFVFGVIHLINKIGSGTFHAGDLDLCHQIGEAGKTVFSIARKYYEADFRIRANAALLTIVRDRSEDRPLQQTWDAAVRVIADFLNPQLCSIFICDNSNNEVFNVASISDEDLRGLTLPFGKGIVGTVAETGVALRTDNAYADPRFFRLVDIYTGQKTKTVLCIPVPGFQRHARPIAVIQVINKLNGLPFYPEEQEVVENIANELSFSLRRKAIELNDLKHRSQRSRIYEHTSEVLEESILREYGAVTKQYVTEANGVQRRVSFLGHAKYLASASNGDISADQIMSLICDHNTDPFLLKENLMIDCAVQMICSYGLLEKFNINQIKLKNFISAVRSKYRPENAFHNFQHAWGVMHLSFMLLRYGAEEFLTALDIFALLISAICHDADHPGNNNAFEIAIRSELALLYSDDSVLERHHLAVTNLLLSDPNISVISGLSAEEHTEFRQTVTSAILATDMSQHFKIVDEIVRRNATASPYSRSDPAARKALIGHILHAADIGAQTQCHSVAMKWTTRLVDEFSSQAQREIEAKIPLTPFLHGLDDDLKRMQLQVGFLNGIVIPLYGAISTVLPELDKMVTKQLLANRDYYQEQVERITAARASGSSKTIDGSNSNSSSKA